MGKINNAKNWKNIGHAHSRNKLRRGQQIGDTPNTVSETVSESTDSDTELSESFLPSPSSGGVLVTFFCVPKRTHRVSLQNSPSLSQNSVSAFFRNSTLETEFHPFPSKTLGSLKRQQGQLNKGEDRAGQTANRLVRGQTSVQSEAHGSDCKNGLGLLGLEDFNSDWSDCKN